MPWSWFWVGLVGGLFVGILLQDTDVQRDLWHFLPFAAKVAVRRIDMTLSVLGLDAQWHAILLFGVVGATCALLLNFLIEGIK